MSLTAVSHDHVNFVRAYLVDLAVSAYRTETSWDSRAREIRRLFKMAIASDGDDRIVIAAERILDVTALMADQAEANQDARQTRLLLSLEQCEAEAQRLFDAYMDRQPKPVLDAYAERGLIAAYGLQDMFVSVSH
ncbi:MAG: hypothetical protein ACHQAY_22455 [Hyphomicrobiales bacterium]